MKSPIQTNLVVCSAIIKPIRLMIFYRIAVWINLIVKIPVHTFAVEESEIPLDPENPKGYWYCAGDFCNIDEAGVFQDLIQIDMDFAKCLVSPNIKDDDPCREQNVISGEYGVHYVCHNITNRILYATKDKSTLIDLDIQTTGYPVVVKSALGIYGQNRVEWRRRKDNCRCCGNQDSDSKIGKNKKTDRTRDEEILRIHLRAADGNRRTADNLTDALNSVDNEFYLLTKHLINQFNRGSINRESFKSGMVTACGVLFSKTINIVGREMTQKIYPDCNIDIGTGIGRFIQMTKGLVTGYRWFFDRSGR